MRIATQGDQFVVSHTLNRGRSRPITARALAELFDVDQRAITQQIEFERAAGAPILADCGEGCSGYYLPSCDEERQEYLRRLDSRIEHIIAHRNAVARARLFGFDGDCGFLSIPEEY